jgi:hypothetical protein
MQAGIQTEKELERKRSNEIMTEETDTRLNALEANIKKIGNALTEKDTEIARLKKICEDKDHEIDRLSHKCCELAARPHYLNGPWDRLHKASTEIDHLKDEINKRNEILQDHSIKFAKLSKENNRLLLKANDLEKALEEARENRCPDSCERDCSGCFYNWAKNDEENKTFCKELMTEGTCHKWYMSFCGDMGYCLKLVSSGKCPLGKKPAGTASEPSQKEPPKDEPELMICPNAGCKPACGRCPHREPHKKTGDCCFVGRGGCAECIPYKEPAKAKDSSMDLPEPPKDEPELMICPNSEGCEYESCHHKKPHEHTGGNCEFSGNNCKSCIPYKEPTVSEMQQPIRRENTVAGALHYDIEVQGRRIDAYTKEQIGFDERLEALEIASKAHDQINRAYGKMIQDLQKEKKRPVGLDPEVRYYPISEGELREAIKDNLPLSEEDTERNTKILAQILNRDCVN